MALLDSPDQPVRHPALKWLFVVGVYMLGTRLVYSLLMPIAQSILSGEGYVDNIGRFYEKFNLVVGLVGLVVTVLVIVKVNDRAVRIIFALLTVFNAYSLIFSLISLFNGPDY